MEEREEGEVSDGNEDSFGLSYKPVVRPDTSVYRRVQRHVPSSDEDCSSDSDSDSPLAPKRNRPNVFKMDTGSSERHDPRAWTADSATQETRPVAKARRRNNIWSSVMEEQVLSQEIGGFGLKRRLDQGDRSVETYDYVAARQYQLDHPDSEDEEAEEEEDEETKKKRMNRKRHVKERLVHRKSKTKGGKRELVEVEVGEAMTDEEVGRTIAEGLMERKPELIVRVVEVLGREKALDLYKDTQELERDGGMLVVPPPSKTDTLAASDQPLEIYNGGFLNIEVKPSAQSKVEDEKNRGGAVAYDDDIFDIHPNEEMELF
ncbi:Phosphorylated adapter RNA export protein [Chionoecetes opilio]|uniref:Phosphorylated adapter RNA export protein n=1 Tax=Chionoecetes opilio TaxID=41210 RepID=A0A8J4YEA3_CHIOP|nr:Phosphorylated adapter RNA export protein [Chionoecetes opilio]